MCVFMCVHVYLRTGVPNLWDLMPNDLRWNWCNSPRNECTRNVMLLNHPKTRPWRPRHDGLQLSLLESQTPPGMSTLTNWRFFFFFLFFPKPSELISNWFNKENFKIMLRCHSFWTIKLIFCLWVSKKKKKREREEKCEFILSTL